MTAFSSKKSGFCGFSAAACTFALCENSMDTALGVVSIPISLENPLICP